MRVCFVVAICDSVNTTLSTGGRVQVNDCDFTQGLLTWLLNGVCTFYFLKQPSSIHHVTPRM